MELRTLSGATFSIFSRTLISCNTTMVLLCFYLPEGSLERRFWLKNGCWNWVVHLIPQKSTFSDFFTEIVSKWVLLGWEFRRHRPLKIDTKSSQSRLWVPILKKYSFFTDFGFIWVPFSMLFRRYFQICMSFFYKYIVVCPASLSPSAANRVELFLPLLFFWSVCVYIYIYIYI